MGFVPVGSEPQTAAALLARRLARPAEAVHGLTYYPAEIHQFGDNGFRGWWHAYFAYRPSAMGTVPAGVVQAAFYNFAPSFVGRSLPGVWNILTPTEVALRRLELVEAAIRRIYADGEQHETLEAAAELLGEAVLDLPVQARPLFAAYAEQPKPSEQMASETQSSHWMAASPTWARVALDVWHGCTLLREYRGDGHNIALAAAGIDGCECHVLMAAHGHGNQPTITGIRGWSEADWASAVDRLRDRGFVDESGEFTDDGLSARAGIEQHTDELSSAPVERLGVTKS